MVNCTLQHRYPGIHQQSGSTLGGSQRLLKSATLQRCGCGVVATLDLVRYLHLYRPGFSTDFFSDANEQVLLPLPLYDLYAQRMRRNYVPVIYPVGSTGFGLAGGLNRYFRQYHLPLKARWGVPKAQLWQCVAEMLNDDLPVILSVGNRFPKLWEKRGAALHRKHADQTFYEAAQAHGHYVTVLSTDDQWLRITSWGREYYLSKEEFRRYCDSNSLSILCNIVYLTHKQI